MMAALVLVSAFKPRRFNGNQEGSSGSDGRDPNLSCPRNGKRTRALAALGSCRIHWDAALSRCAWEGDMGSLRQPGYRPTRWRARASGMP